MPTNYTGKTGSVATEAALAVTNASNTNPITITVSGSLPPEFYQSGGLGGSPAAPLVDISGVLGNLAANGIFVATPTGPSTFTIAVSGTGAYTGGGSVQALYLKQLYTVPSDGDNDNAASITPWAEATGDRTQWLASRTGQFKLARREIFQLTDATFNAVDWAIWPAGGVTIKTPQQWTNIPSSWGTTFGLAVSTPSGSGAPVFAIAGVAVGDYVSARLQASFNTITGETALALYGTVVAPGVVPAWPGGYFHMAGSAMLVNVGGGPAVTAPVTSEGVLTGSAVVSGVAWVQPVFISLASTNPALALQGDALMTIDIWRPTGMPQ